MAAIDLRYRINSQSYTGDVDDVAIQKFIVEQKKQALLLRQELPKMVPQNLICQPQVLLELVKHIRSQYVVEESCL